MKVVASPRGKRYIMVGRIGWVHAHPGGKLVLRDETSWRTVSGFFLNTRWGCFWFYWRRFGK